MSILKIGKMKNLTNMVVNIVKDAKKFPVVLTNKNLPIIEESAYIIRTLEDLGYKVETFRDDDIYGIRVYQ